MVGKLYKKPSSLDREMKTHGYGNIVNTFCLGFPTHVALSNTAFHYKSGGTGVISTTVLTVIIGVVLFYTKALSFIGILPRFLLSGAFVYLSIDFLIVYYIYNIGCFISFMV